MHMPELTAEASLKRKGDYYVSLRVTPLKDEGLLVGPASFAALHRFPFPLPGPIDICSACVSDCIRRGSRASSCWNLCSFVCE